MGYAIDAKGLVKSFGNVLALNGCSFTVSGGEVFGLIGPNGAGKTTALRIVGTILKPTSGSVEVFGVEVVRDPDKVRRMISYLPEEAGAYQYLSGFEYLRFMAGFYASGGGEVDEMVEEGRRISGLEERLRDRVKGYSKGMKQRLLLSRALMVRPRLAILDEPTAGLDVVHAHHIRRLIKDYVEKRGVTVLLSSHNMLEVEFLCDRVALIDEGVIVSEGRPEELMQRFTAENLEQVFMEATRIG
ncbi:MAG: ABC transporter ATP-binding protein [Candidatus Bathyarchaeota archaeon]|nr:ABC transporter ATP-binding protein [Candidatus Bathyarchaeota archaeon]